MFVRMFGALFALLFASNSVAADYSVLLQDIAHAGPRAFASFAEQYYGERKAGKSGFQEKETKVGRALGGVMGASVGMLKDDMFSGMSKGYKTGKSVGETVGNGYGTIEGRSHEMDLLVQDYLSDRESLLNAVKRSIDNCLQSDQKLSVCRTSQEVQQLTSRISDLNGSYCRRAITVPSPLDKTKKMLPPSICATANSY